MKKILFVTRTYEYGGAEKHLLELLQRLREPELQLSILCLGADPYSERLGPNAGVRVDVQEKSPESLRDWARLFRNTQADVVVFIYGWIWSFPWAGSAGARLAGIKKRFSIQHLYIPSEARPNLIRDLLRRIVGPINWKIAARSFDTTICVSNALKKSLVENLGFPAKKLRTIHNGVSLSEFAPSESGGAAMRAKLGIRPDEFVLVCAARLSKQKGIEILLEALAQVSHSGVRCKCVIVGDGPLKDQLVSQAHALGLSGNVFFEGFQQDVRPYLHASSALILTSYSEGLPLAILEALACGLPCIVTDVGGNAEAVTNGVEGLVIAPGSADAAAKAISYLATHPHERAEMSKMARARACEEFDIEKCMAEIKRVILN